MIPTHPDAPCSTTSWVGHSDYATQRRQAARACLTCPILWECGNGATDRGERWGVWGGIDRETEYRRAHTHPGAPRRAPAVCGTESGYKAHKRLGAPACDPCKEAHATYQNQWREAQAS